MLANLAERGEVVVEPPEIGDEESVICRYDGEPINKTFVTEIHEDSEHVFHAEYRCGCYDAELRVDFETGRGVLDVREADGYDQ